MTGSNRLALFRHSELPELPDVMTADEVAAYLRLCRKTVYVLARSGEIPCKILGKTFRFSRKAIEDVFHRIAAPIGAP
jgi:excisionase family DNA binding protein